MRRIPQKIPMDTLVFFFSLLIFLPHLSTGITDECEIHPRCGQLPIRFPFRLKHLQPEHCGKPGFDLSCTDNKETVLELPFSGTFFVRKIDYINQELDIYDPLSCLSSRFFSFNLSGSPFSGKVYTNSTFFNCSKDFPEYIYTTIGCLNSSSSAYNIRFLADFTIRYLLPEHCNIMRTVSVPLAFGEPYAQFWLDSKEDRKGVILTWDEPYCRKCESQGHKCGYESSSTSFALRCYGYSRSSFKGKLRMSIAIGVSIAGLLVLLLVPVFIIRAYKKAHVEDKQKQVKIDKSLDKNSVLVPFSESGSSDVGSKE